jgi:hypothetical protein
MAPIRGPKMSRIGKLGMGERRLSSEVDVRQTNGKLPDGFALAGPTLPVGTDRSRNGDAVTKARRSAACPGHVVSLRADGETLTTFASRAFKLIRSQRFRSGALQQKIPCGVA